MKKLFLLCCIAAVIIVCVIARITKYKQFHDAEIQGKLESVYRYRDYVMISVNNEEFRIIPISLSTPANFDEVAKIGDTISKRAGSDRFDLIHEEDEVFLYTVRKYW